MDEPTINQMSDNRVLEVLKELKHQQHGKSPSKYFFALGHAIRFIEHAKEPTNAADGDNTCPHCGRQLFTYCSVCDGKVVRR